MLEIKIPSIKVISVNQKNMLRAMFRKGTREELKKILDEKGRIIFCNRLGEFGQADMAGIMHFLSRQVTAMYFKAKRYKQFQDELKIEIFKAMQGMRRPTYKKNIQLLISISTYLDIDNPVKGIIDVLAEIGIIENDREIRKLKVVKTPAKRGSVESLIIKVEGEQ